VRFFVEWKTLQPAKGDAYPSPDPGAANLANGIDAAIKQVNAAGAQPEFVVLGTPKWANNSDDQYVPPTDPQDYADFFAKFVRHNASVGTVAAYEVWNEEDGSAFWHLPNPNDATTYIALLKAAYRAAKPVAGNALILEGPMTGNNSDYLQQLYAGGAKDSFDGVSVHTDTSCLTNPPDVFITDSQRNDRVDQFSFLGFRSVRQVMLANSDGGKKIWMTELGWSSTGGVAGACSRIPNAGPRSDGVTAAQQAQYLTQAYGCLANYDYIASGFWFTMFDSAQEMPDELRHYGLIDTNGARKPSYDAFANVAAANGGAGGPCGDFTAPTITIATPTPGFGYTGRLLVSASAVDQADPGVTPVGLLRLTFRIDNDPQAFFTKSMPKDGEVASYDYFGASKLPDGEHTITVVARDRNGNQSQASVQVCKGSKCAITSLATSFTFPTGKNPKCRGRICTFSGRLNAPGGVSVSGRVNVEWQLLTKARKYVTLHKGGASAAAPFAFRQKLSRKGKWRVRVIYKGAPPLKGVTSSYVRFTV
jgi:hypothetical protein